MEIPKLSSANELLALYFQVFLNVLTWCPILWIQGLILEMNGNLHYKKKKKKGQMQAAGQFFSLVLICQGLLHVKSRQSG